MRSKPILVLVAAGASVALLVSVTGPAASLAGTTRTTRAASSDANRVRFGSPTVVDPVHAYGEPDIRIADDGATYTSGPWGTGTQRSIWNRSVDGGATFRTLHDTPITSPNQSATTITGPGGGDTELSIDHSGKVYYADLAALATLKVTTWDEQTRTMKTAKVLGPGIQTLNGYDRQWFALWDPKDPQAVRDRTGYTGKFPVNYLIYSQALLATGCLPTDPGCEAAAYSYDGVNYTDATTTYPLSGFHGSVVIDQKTGTVLQSSSIESDEDVGVTILSRGAGVVRSDPSLTKVKQVTIADLPNDNVTTALFPVIAMDNARNAYVVWTTRDDAKTPSQDPTAWQIYYSHATAKSHWEKWSKPVQLSSGLAATNVMPWVTAGSKGRIAAVWYGTDDAAHDPSSEDVHQAWDVYLANITDANSSDPVVTQQKVTRHPMHYGTICFQGTACIAQAGNRNLADFFEVTTDPSTGAITIVYDDTSNDQTETIANGEQVPDGAADHKGAPLVTVVKQNRGIGLFGTAVHGKRSVKRRIKDAKKDAFFDPVYGDENVKQLDIRKLKMRKKKQDLIFRLKVKRLKDPAAGLAATGAQALDWVIRWTGTTGEGKDVRNPIYFVEAESTGGDPTYSAGEALTYELCSVSGCFPHGFVYPAPPLAGATVPGEVKIKHGKKPDVFKITVPLAVVGDPAKGSKLQSFGAYAFASPRPASQPLTNGEAEADRVPVEVDGDCCREAKVKGKRRHHHKKR